MTDEDSRPNDSKRRGESPGGVSMRMGAGKKIAFSAFILVFFLVSSELLLALFWRPPPPVDPYVGFSTSVPLLVRDEQDNETGKADAPTLRINPAKRIWFNDQSFPEKKANGVYRIVCLGGSTTFGRPFDDATSFCGWLRELLPMVDQDRQWEVINAGGISYASYRIAAVMQEFASCDVDLFILYTGQNEFLEDRTYGDLIGANETPRLMAALAAKTHLGRSIQHLVQTGTRDAEPHPQQILSGEVDEILNHSIGPASYKRDLQWYRGVEDHFRFNLGRMERIAHDAGAQLAVVTPVSNLRDCTPFKSEFDEGHSVAMTSRLDAGLAKAKQAISDGAYDDAFDLLEMIQHTDRLNADVDFMMGRVFFHRQEYDRAAESFQSAIDHDVCPLRATSRIKSIVRQFIDDGNVIAVDFESVLTRSLETDAGHACFGAESFLDHVHPTVDVHRELAVAIIDSMVTAGLLSAGPSDQHIATASERVTSRLDRNTQGVAFRNLAKVTHWAGKFEEAKRNAEDALRLMPLDLESHYVLADCLYKTGRYEAALDRYTRLFEIGDFSRACQPFGELLAETGHVDAAKAYLMQAILSSEGGRQASAYDSLGRLHLSLGEDELAEQCFKSSAAIK